MLWSQFSAILPIFGKKLAFFLNSNVGIQSFKKPSSILNKTRHFFPHFWAKNIFKTLTSVSAFGEFRHLGECFL
jgi:hypothetical protein